MTRRLLEFEDAPGYAKDAADGTILATDTKMLEDFRKRAKAHNRMLEMNYEINILRQKLSKLTESKSK